MIIGIIIGIALILTILFSLFCMIEVSSKFDDED